MKGFKIIVLTQAGKDALQQQLLERRKQSFVARTMFARMFDLSHDDETMTVQIKSAGIAAVIQPEDIKKKIVEGFGEQGAVEDKDFIVEVF